MRIPTDKKMHLELGVPLSILLTTISIIAVFVGIGYAVMFGSIAFGIGVEVYQKIRNEGTFSWADAACSAAFGVVAGLGWDTRVIVVALMASVIPRELVFTATGGPRRLGI